jgi:Spy/CpxP family protein refolding chaperone
LERTFKMRFTGKVWVAMAFMVVVAMVSQVALAQNEQGQRGRGNRGGGPGGPGGGGRGPVSMARLATIDKVQDVLKLSDEQKEKIKKINDDVREEMRKAFQDGGGRESMQKLGESSAKKLNEVLDEGQQKRLMGILIQLQGAGAVNDPAVAKELNITDDQKSKLAEAREENMKAMQGAFAGGRDQNGSREEMRSKMDKLREEANKKVMALLTSEQQQKLESLKGEKVDIDMSALRGPGGGDRPRGDRPNRGRDRGNRGSEQPAEKKSAA